MKRRNKLVEEKKREIENDKYCYYYTMCVGHFCNNIFDRSKNRKMVRIDVVAGR